MALNGTTKCDWHRADIIAALHKKGTSLAALSRAAGLNARTLNNVLERKYPKAEELISSVLGIPAAEIWPSRYTEMSAGDQADE